MQCQLYGQTNLFHQLFELLHLVRASNHFARLSAEARADLALWKCFLQVWNGSSFFPLPHHLTKSTQTSLVVFGGGALSKEPRWFQIEWTKSWEEIDISTKEQVPVSDGGCNLGETLV